MKLWKFYWDCRRMGSVTGLFFATKKAVDEAIGSEVYFGEILGKHSEIYGTLDMEDLTEIKLQNAAAEALVDAIGETVSGYNPLNYIQEELEDV